LRYWNIDGAAEEREEEEGEDKVRTDPEPFIGIADEANLNEDKKEDKEEKEGNNKQSSEREKVEATHRISLPNAIASIYMITDQDGRSNRVRLMERRTLVRALFLGRGADNPPQLFSFQNLFFQE
jgi:hypothetical protein